MALPMGMFMGGNTSVNQFIASLPHPSYPSSPSGAGGLGTLAGGFFAAAGIREAGRARQIAYRGQIEQLMDQDALQRRQSLRLASQQRASFGAAGVRSTMGTAQEAQNMTMQDMVLNNMRIIKGVRNVQEQARRDRRNTKRAASRAVAAGAISAVGMMV